MIIYFYLFVNRKHRKNKKKTKKKLKTQKNKGNTFTLIKKMHKTQKNIRLKLAKHYKCENEKKIKTTKKYPQQVVLGQFCGSLRNEQSHLLGFVLEEVFKIF